MEGVEKIFTFTFIVEFRGGTYCTQVEAKTINESVKKWVSKIKKEQSEIKHLGDKIIRELESDLKNIDNKPILLTGLKNVWCTSASTKKDLS